MKVTKQEYFVVDSGELNDLVHKAISGLEYWEFEAAAEARNGNVYRYTVEPCVPGGTQPSAVLNYLCWLGLIEPGEYLVAVCW